MQERERLRFETVNGRAFPFVVTGVIAILVVGVPLVGVVGGLARLEHVQTTTTPAFVWEALWRTIWVSGLIAGVAVILGGPAGWAMRGRRGWSVILMTPLLLPSYLAYSGWGVLRGPGSWIGDWIARGEAVRSLFADGVLAVGGLALWAWPLAAVWVAASARGVGQEALDALALEPAGWVRRVWELARLSKRGLVGGFVSVMMVMFGSAIPLHLAQVETLAIHVWKYMSLVPEPVRGWAGAWPLVAIAGAAGVMVARGMIRASDGRDDEENGQEEGAQSGRGVVVWSSVVWSASVILPLLLYAMALKDRGSVVRFWRESGDAVVASGQTGVCVGGMCTALMLGVWGMVSMGGKWGKRMAGITVGVMAFLALVPGVLIGAAMLSACSQSWAPWFMRETNLPLVLAHVARFGVLGAAGGAWLGMRESLDQRGAREMYGPGLVGWVWTRVRAGWGAAAGMGMACAALSLQEIEATVQLAAPGPQALSQRLLDLLHYARDEQLAAAAINMLGICSVVGILGAWMWSWGSRRGDVHWRQ